ncbi:LVIVD repeat-containing protein [Natronococcus wangiae]|uniref:regulatory P domain-containing protein n=1 Tax=Natronococcus wangiae TaxID=3068275 RepID=UPI0027402A8D|nr:regulatory P domain-containing protein [Natronococcus sp. AD5]
MTGSRRRAFMKRAGSTSVGVAAFLGGTVTADRSPGHGRRRTRGRLDKLGQALPPGGNPNHVTYSFGHVSEDGAWGAASSWPAESQVASTLYDLSDLENPERVHELDAPNEETRSNDVKFDPLREGIYIRGLEANDEGSFFDPEPDPDGKFGIEVVDFGWENGSPEEPAVIAYLETPTMGVHKLTEHPEKPILYLIDKVADEPGIISVDFSKPDDPTIRQQFGPRGYCHDVEVEPGRNALHAVFAIGEAVGYATFDLSDDPYDPRQLGFFDYEEQPGYTELGEPGFEIAHQVHPEPERELSIVGDEMFSGVPGGKHIFDTGWDEGSLEDPQPIGFTHSPDARNQDEEPGAWTTHFHDVVYDRGEVLLVDGGYTQGAWVANITDPTDPTPTERYATDDGVEGVTPYTWGAFHNEARDFAFVTDSGSGVYTFDVSGKAARGEDGGGPDHYYDIGAVLGTD